MQIEKIFSQIGVNLDKLNSGAGFISSVSPINGKILGAVAITNKDQYEDIILKAQATSIKWSAVPAPKRGDIIRQIGNALREHKDTLGSLVTLETGKIKAEGDGEIQEAIDIADFAVGLSRQLYGLTMHSERSDHRMYEQWHPLGLVGVITAFNFPAAVWAWNAMLSAVCGNVTIWKPSEKTPLTALAMIHIAELIAAYNGFSGLFPLVFDSDASIGKLIAEDKRIPLVSATGSTRMGVQVGSAVAQRLGRSLLELGGNNAVIIAPDADLKLVVPAVVFGAVGTSGQRCTTTRRLLVHSSLIDEVIKRLISAYKQIKIGNPLEEGVLMGPLISSDSVAVYHDAISKAVDEGATICYGGESIDLGSEFSKQYVLPTIIKGSSDLNIAKEETFAPILYVISYEEFDDAIKIQNDVKHGLSSALFTNNLKYAEQFLSCHGSDCGIANINIGTSGAEIGGAFGGEKETGGGRESGSDAWRNYMRRQTNTINYSNSLPLAQGIKFDLS